MSKNYSKDDYKVEECIVEECTPYPEVAKEKKVKPSQDTLLVLIVSTILIVIGILSTLAIFLGWQTFMTYLVAGIGFMCVTGGLISLGCALVGVWE